jgi:hypothetical protein
VNAELVLSYGNGRWRASGEGLTAEHSELQGLERELAGLLAARGATRAHLRFDLDGLPHWLRQYHAHYCNYVLHVPPRGAQ